MKHFFKFTFIVVTGCILFFSCKQRDEKPVNNFGAYLGGTFEKDTFPFVMLLKNNRIIDTLPVNSHKEFGKKFDALIPGMYTFKYGPFHENVFFDKNDRIFIKIATGDFENKIEYSGKGSNKNNFLKELLNLVNDEQHDCSFLYKKAYAAFKISADSLRDNRRALYLRKKTEIHWNKDFDKYVKSVIDYAYYTTLEEYPLTRKLTTGAASDSLPSAYYDFRSKVLYNEEALSELKPYTTYLGLLCKIHAQRSKNQNQAKKALTTLRIADSLISNQVVKNKVTEYLAYSYFLSDPQTDLQNDDGYLESFKKINTNPVQKDEVGVFFKSLQTFKQSKQLPLCGLYGSDGITLANFKNKGGSLVFFWSSNYDSLYQKMLGLTAALKKKHPKLKIFIVNTDLDEKTWKEKVTDDRAVIHLRTAHFSELKEKWFVCSPKRVILLHDDGTIKTPFFNLFDAPEIKN